MSRKPSPPFEQLLTVTDVSKHCQVCDKTVRRWIKNGDLEFVRLGRGIRVRPEAFERFIRERTI